MVDLSEAGARLRDYRPELTPSVDVIIRRRDRRRRRRRLTGGLGGLAVLTAVVVVAAVAVAAPGTGGRRIATATGGTRSSPGPAGSATAAQLAAGRWSTLPVPPIAPRSGSSVLWTGTELLMWGGYSGVDPHVLRGDGAAFNPATNRWRLLPAAPISAREGQTAVWTGSEMVVWGGQDGPSRFQVTADGAAYSPASDAWKVLSAAPLSARTDALGIWTDKGMLILGGLPRLTTGFNNIAVDGALYNPANNTWHHIATPSAPPDHGLAWSIAVSAGDEVLAWSQWTIAQISGANGVERAGSAGVDLFAYNERSGQWRHIPSQPDSIQGVDQAVWTGRNVIVRGTTSYCGPGCKGPPQPEATALYTLADNAWTPLPTDPLANTDPLSVWTGAALFSIDVSAISGTKRPGDSAAFDPATREWVTVPSAPSGCDGGPPHYQAPVWTGREVLLYCPSSSLTQIGSTAGLVLTPGP